MGGGVALPSYRMVWWARYPQDKRTKSYPHLSIEIILLVLPFLDPKWSMASIMLLLSFTFPRTTFAIQPLSLGSTVGKTVKHWCMVQYLPWTRCQDLDSLGWNFLPHISLHRWNCHQCHLWCVKSPSWHMSPRIFCERRTLISKFSLLLSIALVLKNMGRVYHDCQQSDNKEKWYLQSLKGKFYQ